MLCKNYFFSYSRFTKIKHEHKIIFNAQGVKTFLLQCFC